VSATISRVARDDRHRRPFFFVIKVRDSVAHLRFYTEDEALAEHAKLTGEQA
jgi:hypothetical protein